MRLRNLFRLLAIGAVISVAGCGGGGGGGGGGTVQPPATKAIVKLATAGTLPAGTSIGVIGATVMYPTTKGLSIADMNVVPSGVAAGGTVAANVSTLGQVFLGNLTLTSTGFPIGEFATLTFSIASGSTPVVTSDFVVAPDYTVLDAATSNSIPGVSVIVQSVTFQ